MSNQSFNENIKSKSDLKLFSFMMKYAGGVKKSILLALLLLTFSTVMFMIRPVIIGQVIDLFIHGENEIVFKGIFLYGGLYLLVLLLISFVIFLQSSIIGKAGQHILYNIRTDIFKHVIKLDMKYFDRTQTGKIVTRITNDTETLNEMYTSVLLNVVKDIFLITGVIIASFIVNTALALVILAVLPFVILTALVFRKTARNNYGKLRTHISSLNAFLSETISGIRTIQLFNIQKKKKNEFDKINSDVYKTYIIEIIVYGIFRPLMFFSTQLIFCAVLYFSAKLVISGEMTIGTVFVFIQFLNMLFEPIYELAEQFNIFQSAISATEKIDGTLSVKPSVINSGFSAPVDSENIKGKIEFKNVWFAYDNEEWVLKDVSFVINPGESAALVGPTGAGKSSIINLIARYYDIQKGEILIDGINIRDIDIDSLRSSIGVVMQDVFVFAGTFRENIRLFNESITDQDVEKAAEFVNASFFINRYKEGYDHQIEEKGAALSSGQRQLLSFARVMAFKTPILILDEATANIDTETEKLIQNAVNRIMEGRTTIAIAHRLSTIQHVNKIMVVSKGEICESGTHQELLNMKGKYYQLYTHQYF